MSPSVPVDSPENRFLAANPNTGSEQLRELGKSIDESVLQYLAENKSTPLDLLIELADHGSVAVRMGLGDNPVTPIHILFRLARDESTEVRFALAENHHLPHPVLVVLLEDENPWIKMRAEKTLTNLGLPTEVKVEQRSEEDNQIHVLVAEDNAHIRFLISRILDKDPDIKVVFQAEDGRATVEQTFLCHPDVILMDIAMPNMSGVVATEIIKKQAPKTKVIMVTGSDTEDDITKAFKAGADGYFLKSTPFSELPRCIKSVYADASWLDPGISTTILKKCFMGTRVKGKEETFASAEHEVALSVINVQLDAMLEDEVFEDAILLCKATIKLCERLYGKNAQVTAQWIARLAEIYFSTQDYKISENILLQGLKKNEHLLNHADENADYVIVFLGKMAEAQGNPQQAELYYTWSLRIRERLGDPRKIREARIKLEQLNYS